ncbi:hypothetical protein FB451DRAFT_187159 [Mycena latifolia]|nr:hypothetical protein FB451DRAFT_187159 [Mycena latifolia]
MSFLKRILSPFSAHETPPPGGVGTIPCTGMDLGARDIVLTTGLIINTRLDAKKLEDSLSTLIVRKFPRSGARLALRNGVYEFQVPHTFDANTLPVTFTVDDYPETYRSLPRPELPIHLPHSTQPSLRRQPALEAYFRSRGCPSTLDGFLVPNMPSVHVHVAVFDDLTFIGMTSSHICFDALGTQTLLHAWTRLLKGDAINAIPGMEWDAAPFETFTKPTAVTHQSGWFDLGLLSQLLFIIRLVMRLLWDSKEVTYIVRVPKAFLDDSKREIMEDLKLQRSSEWVGSSDVLMAWWFKTVHGYRSIDDTTPVHIHFPVNIREKPVFPNASALNTPYIHNAVLGIPIPPIPANAFRTESLGSLALRMRRAVNAYNADPAGIAADLHWRCANPLKVLFPCPPRGEYALQTSWRAARYGELDFSGACVGESVGPRVVFCIGIPSSGASIPLRGNGAVLMEDEDAVWMSQVRGAKDWENIRRSGSVAFI